VDDLPLEWHSEGRGFESPRVHLVSEFNPPPDIVSDRGALPVRVDTYLTPTPDTS